MGGGSKGKLLFIPTYNYLSNPLFFNLSPKLSEYSLVYFDTEEFRKTHILEGSVLSVVSNPINQDEIKEIRRNFDEYYKVELPKYFLPRNLSRIFSEFDKIIEQIKVFKKYCQKVYETVNEINPLAIVSTSDLSISLKISQKWAKENCVPFILLQPSFFDIEEKENHNILEMFKYVFFNKILRIPRIRRQSAWGNEDEENYVIVWGDYFKNLFNRKPIYHHVYALGSPKFSSYFRNDYKNEGLRKKIFHELKINSDKKIITICTEAFESMVNGPALTQLNNIYKAIIKGRPALFFIIKLHPRENIEFYQDIFEDAKTTNYKIVKNISLYDVYRITDVQISVMSASSFEAVVAGIPIILVNPDNKIKLKDHFFENRIELRARNFNELLLAIDNALSNEYKDKEFNIKREGYLKEMIHRLDDKAEDRIANVIKEIVGEHAKK